MASYPWIVHRPVVACRVRVDNPGLWMRRIRRRSHGQLQGLPVLPREPDHPGRCLARGTAEENELGRPAAGIHKMGEEQDGCGGGHVFIHRRSRRDQNVTALLDRQPKADGGTATRAG